MHRIPQPMTPEQHRRAVRSLVKSIIGFVVLMAGLAILGIYQATDNTNHPERAEAQRIEQYKVEAQQAEDQAARDRQEQRERAIAEQQLRDSRRRPN